MCNIQTAYLFKCKLFSNTTLKNNSNIFFSGGLANRADTKCVENIRQSWKYADGTGWSKDPFVKAKCEKDALGKRMQCIFFTWYLHYRHL